MESQSVSLTSRKNLIDKYHQETLALYKEHNLNSLMGIYADYLVNNVNILGWFLDIQVAVNKARNRDDLDIKPYFDDLIFCSEEILHFTSQVFMFRPFINNPIEDQIPFYDRIIYPNLQNLYGKRYNMYLAVLAEKHYNYWDRIGDLLAFILNQNKDSDKIYFAKIIDSIPAKFHQSKNYQWLKKFKDGNYQKISKQRQRITHETSFNTEYTQDHLKAPDDLNEMHKLQNNHKRLSEFYKNQMLNTIEGFKICLLLSEEIIGIPTLQDKNKIN